MKKVNVFKDNIDGLERHTDDRGVIADIFYNTQIHHVAVVNTKPHSLRGNHYHKESTQHMLMTKGRMEYWYKPVGSTEPSQMVMVEVGDLVSTPPGEIHALRYLDDAESEFIVFSEGPRGGADYETDTFRTDSIFDGK
jgi:mannose-6-phosphate isomerase-like protein (cupin superfamily)